MMLMLSVADFARLSPSCQQEILGLLASRTRSDDLDSDDEQIDERHVSQSDHALSYPDSDDVLSVKRVVEITPDEARALVANISPKSKQSLARFASGEPVSLEELVGKTATYQDYSELKRSFIGAVNRRLRTVTGNRRAVLFASDASQTRIRIKPRTAAAIRQALNMQEPLPSFQFFTKDGLRIEAQTKEVQLLRLKLGDAWQSFDGRPSNQRAAIDVDAAIRHFAGRGFTCRLGYAQAWDEDALSETFRISPENVENTEMLAQIDARGILDANSSVEQYAVVFLLHPDVTGVLVRFEAK